MVYFKILSADGTVKSVEALADPVYVCWQTRNGILIRCDKRDAQGVMSSDGNTIYQLQGKQLSGVESDELLSAVSITLAEYEELAAQVGTTDPDDDTPVNPPDDPGTEILTRAQLTEQVLALEDTTALEAVELFPAWKTGTVYTTGRRVRHGGILYTVLQDHTAQDSWTPDAAPSLFAKVLIPNPDVIPEWEQPDSTNPYKKGDRVRFNGKVYESLIDNNVWSPSAYPAGWREVSA